MTIPPQGNPYDQPNTTPPGNGTPPPQSAPHGYGASAGYPQPQPGLKPGPGEPFDGAWSPDDLSRPLYGASFGQAVKRFFKQYANFTGRASRSEFWWAILFMFLIELVPLLLMLFGGIAWGLSVASNTRFDEYGDPYLTSDDAFFSSPAAGLVILGVVLLVVIGLALIVPHLALYWRRLHDANLAGPFYFLTLTSIGGIIVLVFTLLPPRPEGRRFLSSRAG